MLLPKRVKHRKQHRGRMTGVATRGNKVTYGEYGLQTTEPAWITAAQIEAARIAMTRYTKRSPDPQVIDKLFKYSLISRLQQDLPILVWVKVKVMLTTG